MTKITIAHISDTHGDNSFVVPKCDIFIHSGDFTNLGTDNEYILFFKKIAKFKNIITLFGNHDNVDNKIEKYIETPFNTKLKYFILKQKFLRKFLKFTKQEDCMIYLKNNAIIKKNINFNTELIIKGYTLCPPVPYYLYTKELRQLLLNNGFKDSKWANEADEKTRWDQLDKLGYCDILVSHAPPTSLKDGIYDNEGCDPCLRDYILKYEPKYVFCGHVHQVCGIYEIGKTKIIVSHNKMRTFEIEF